MTTGFHLGPAPADLVERSRAAAARVFGDYGIVRRCVRLQPEGLPRLTVYAAAGPHRIPGWRFFAEPEGTGVALDEEQARLAAISEAVERYATMAPAREDLLVRASCAELEGAAVSVSRFALLSSSQYRRFRRLAPAADTRAIDWVWGASLTHARAALLPAALVHMCHDRHAPNNFVGEVTSSGTACHVSLPHASLAGLCEVLERDALTIWWQNRLRATRLDTTGSAVDELVRDALAGARHTFTLYALPTDSPFPVVLALATHADSPCATIGVACRPSPEAAAVRALLEAGQVLTRLSSRPPRRPERMRTLDDHADFYATAQGAAHVIRAVADATDARLADLDDRSTEWTTVETQLEGAVRELAPLNLEVLVADLTTPDVADAGYRVVRVVVPGTVDMAADARCPRLGGSRMYELPVQLGLREKPLTERQINRLPVPLA